MKALGVLLPFEIIKIIIKKKYIKLHFRIIMHQKMKRITNSVIICFNRFLHVREDGAEIILSGAKIVSP